MPHGFEQLPVERGTEGVSAASKERPERASWWQRHWERFRERAETLLGKTPELPPVSLEIFYAPHSSAEDLEGLEKFLERADVYIPEGVGWSPRSLKLFRKVAEGSIAPKDLLKRLSGSEPHIARFFTRQLELIAHSHTPLTFIDLPRGSKLLSEWVVDFPLQEDFSETLRGLREWEENKVSFQKKRESHMLQELRPQLKKLLSEYPALKKKKELRVLLTLGAFHTGIYRDLQKSGETVGQSFRFMPTVFGYESEAARRAYFGKPIGDELLARILVGTIFWEVAGENDFSNTSAEYIELYIRKELEKLTMGDLRYIYEETMGKKSQGETFYGRARRAFEARGVHIPTGNDIIAFRADIEKKRAEPRPSQWE